MQRVPHLTCASDAVQYSAGHDLRICGMNKVGIPLTVGCGVIGAPCQQQWILIQRHAMGERSPGCIKYSVLMVTGYGIMKTPSISFNLNKKKFASKFFLNQQNIALNHGFWP